MKTQIFIFLLTNFLNCHVFGQKSNSMNINENHSTDSATTPKPKSKTNVVVYNFQKGIFESDNIKPEYGKPIVFKIKDINRIYYSPNIKGVVGEDIDANIGSKPPAKSENSDVKAPNENNSSLAVSKRVLNESKSVDKIQISDVNDVTIDDMGETKMVIKRLSQENINTTDKLYQIYKTKLSILSKNFQTYRYVINKINSNYNNYLEKINSPDLTHEIYKKLYDDSNLSKVEKNRQNPFETSSIIVAAKHENKYITLNQYFETKVEFKEFLNSKEIQDVMSVLDETGNNVASENIRKDIEEWKTYIAKTDEDITKMNLHQKLSYVEMINRILLNENSYEYVSEPIQAYGDYLSFEIDVKEKRKLDNEYIIFNSNKKFSYKEFVRGGMRLDFGVGVSLDFGHKDEEYSINEDNVGNKFLLQSTKSDYYPKLVGLLHASKRSSTNTAFGFSLGTALDVANFDISSIYIGPSLLWGRSDKIIFTAGPSFKKIKQLNPQFEKYISQEALQPNFNLDDSKYVNNYKIGFFLSITYNLTNAQRGKFLQIQKSE